MNTWQHVRFRNCSTQNLTWPKRPRKLEVGTKMLQQLPDGRTWKVFWRQRGAELIACQETPLCSCLQEVWNKFQGYSMPRNLLYYTSQNPQISVGKTTTLGSKTCIGHNWTVQHRIQICVEEMEGDMGSNFSDIKTIMTAQSNQACSKTVPDCWI